MSLTEIRARWQRHLRDAGSDDGDHILVAATFTADPIAPYLGMAYGDQTGAPPNVSIAPYNQLFQVCFDWKQAANGRPVTAIVLLWRIEDFIRPEFQRFVRGDSTASEAAAARIAELAAAVRALRQTFPGIIAVGVPGFPHSSDHHVRASRSTREAGAFHRCLCEAWLAELSEIENISIVDLDAIQRFIGIEQTFDDRKLYLFRQPFTERFWSELGQDLASLLLRQKVAAKKCIVLDCDNTLWGGIVGEDGLGGIAIGEDFPGSVFRDFQHQIVSLYAQGVMVALCSKNNEADVWEVFDKHDGMILKRHHVVAHRINWQNKPANIIELAKELNIGIDSMVFVDDNAMEIAHVREALPSVTCIHVPSDLSKFPSAFGAFRLFDRDQISEEDRTRSDMMLQEAKRKEFVSSIDAEDFRKSLGLVVDVFPIEAEHVARATQLINKSNQFNLTTRRKTASDLSQLIQDDRWHPMAIRVSDRFGDYGLVGVVILEQTDAVLNIESLLMSCRVLGRGVEEAIFAATADLAERLGAGAVRGEYVPSSKNAMVADLYKRYRFREVGENFWETDDLADYSWPDHIERRGV